MNLSRSARTRAPVALTARQRARAEVTAEILAAARRQLAAEGTSGVNLRALARDLGMPSSGIYRYFSTKEELLTRLIFDAYNSVGAATEASQGGIEPTDLLGRFSAACWAVRRWALENPYEYGLVFGAPVPDYQSPEGTLAAAARVPAVLAAILIDSAKARRRARTREIALTEAGRRAITPAVGFFADALPPERVQRAIMTWSGLFGAISFELYGHLHGVVAPGPDERDAWFDSCIAVWAGHAGIT